MPTSPAQRRTERRHLVAAQLASLTLANAVVFQAELAEADPRVKQLDDLLAQDDLRSSFRDHWTYICTAINYVPIFKLATQILARLPARAETNNAIRSLVHSVRGIVSNRAALRHDLMGRVYHRLLLEAKFLGTFYTSVPAATLLQKLALAPPSWDLDWSDPAQICSLRIADIACGTGTLLMAAEQAAVDNFIRVSADKGIPVGPASVAKVHKGLIEEVLHGYDVLPSAIHLTASTLALLAVDTSFRSMHLYSMPYGVGRGGHVSLGSLDFYSAQSLRPQITFLDDGSAPPTAGAVGGEGSVASLAPLPRLDLCCINPPFTRSAGKNLLFGSLPPAERQAMQDKLREMVADASRRGSANWSNTAGLGAMFVAIAAARVKDGGRLALVLPAAVAFGSAWARTRLVIERDYRIDYIIASHDSERWSFSENTDLSEVLIIATKKRDGELQSDPRTTIVNLTKLPSSAVDALSIGEAVLSAAVPYLMRPDGEPETGICPLVVGGQQVGEVFSVPESSFKSRQWNAVAFAQTELNRTARLASVGHIRMPGTFTSYRIPLCPLSALGTLGPDGRDVYDGFGISALRTQFGAVWGYDSAQMNTISMPANKYLTPLPAARRGRKLRDIGLIWPRAGRLLIPDKIWLVTRTAVAVRTNRPVLSNVWWPVRVKDDDVVVEKILALWFNSSIGILHLLLSRVPTRGPFIKFKKPQLNDLPVLDTTKLTARQRSLLVRTFDETRSRPLRPLPQMRRDPTRVSIDEAICKALELPSLSPLRQALSQEPIVTGHRLEASR